MESQNEIKTSNTDRSSNHPQGIRSGSSLCLISRSEPIGEPQSLKDTHP